MIRIFLLGLFLLPLQSFANTADEAVNSACKSVYTYDSIGVIVCIKSARYQLQEGTELPVVIAKTCDRLAQTPDDDVLFQTCFSKALPETPVPPGFPTEKLM